MAKGLLLTHPLSFGADLAGTGLSAVGGWMQRVGQGWRGRGRAGPAGDAAAGGSPGRVASLVEQRPAMDPITLATWLWGDDTLLPEVQEETIELVRPFALNKGSQLLMLGAGLGGGVAAIHRATGCRVLAFERDPVVLSRLSPELAKLKRVEFKVLDAAGPPSAPRSDHAYLRFVGVAAADRAGLIARAKAAILPGGHITVVDYATGLQPSGGIVGWIARQPAGATPWPSQQWSRAFRGAGFDLRIEEDISQSHRALILSSWQRMLTGGRLRAYQKSQLGPLGDAAEKWMREAMLIEAGALRVMRFYAISQG